MADIVSHASLTTGLISYWDMEESSGSRYDLHGTNNLTENGTGGVGQGTGKIGNCADLTASDSDVLSHADNADFSQTGDMSWSMWINADSLPSTNGTNQGLVEKLLGTGNQRSYMFAMSYGVNTTDTPEWRIGMSSDGVTLTQKWLTRSATSTSTWYHVVFTYDASAGEVEVWVNGASEGTVTGLPTSVFDSSTTAYIGAAPNSLAAYHDGLLEEVGFWSKVLSDQEISDLFAGGDGLPYYAPDDIKNDTTLSTSLVSFWELEEATAATRTDSHGSNDLSNNSGGSGILQGTGIQGNCADFELDDSEDLTIASPTGLGLTSDFSVNFWVNPESLAASAATVPVLYKYYDGSTRAWEFGMGGTADNTKIDAYLGSSDGSSGTHYTSTTGVFATSTWVMVTIVVDTTNELVRFYKNGAAWGTAAKSDNVGSNSGGFSIGGDYYFNNRFFDGLIDEVGIWSKVLGVDEVRALYGYSTPPVYEAAGASGPANLKTLDTVAAASVKTINGTAIASVKTINTVV